MVVDGRISTGGKVGLVCDNCCLLQINKVAHLKGKSFSFLSFSLAFWISTEPDDWKVQDPENGEDCATLGGIPVDSNEYCWYDRTCKHALRSICEKAGKPGYLICAEI